MVPFRDYTFLKIVSGWRENFGFKIFVRPCVCVISPPHKTRWRWSRFPLRQHPRRRHFQGHRGSIAWGVRVARCALQCLPSPSADPISDFADGLCRIE
jgi:hypothetical protein